MDWTEYIGEFLLLLGIGALKLFGRTESAEKLAKKRKKRRTKLEKKVVKHSKQLEREVEELKEV